jgi:NADPH:quinone reductase-like Zn-dependent oxidoreductase
MAFDQSCQLSVEMNVLRLWLRFNASCIDLLSQINVSHFRWGQKSQSLMPATSFSQMQLDLVSIFDTFTNFHLTVSLGTWRQEAIFPDSKLLKLPPTTAPLPYLATLTVNPSTSYRLLRDFAHLKSGRFDPSTDSKLALSRLLSGDVIIQNAANSMVGIGVIQMAKQRGIQTINVVRSDR